MTRPRRLRLNGFTVILAALGLLLAVTPFLPGGGGERGAVLPASTDEAIRLAHAIAGPSSVTPAAQAEIDRVVAAGATSASTLTGRPTPGALVSAQVRCAVFEGQQYCLHAGWTNEPASDVVAELTTETTVLSARPLATRVGTGDADIATVLQRSAALTPTARTAADRAELTAAAQAIAKVWLIRNQVEGVPLPAGFVERHPEIRLGGVDGTPAYLTQPSATPTSSPGSSPTTSATTSATASPTASPAARSAAPAAGSTTSASPTSSTGVSSSPSATSTTKSYGDYPQSAKILSTDRVAEQTRTYYCGPTSMQMIAWNWLKTKSSQDYWAGKLGTTSSGTAITEMVRVTNAYTGWDRSDFAGPYIVLNVGNYSYGQWWLLNMRHIYDYRAPLIYHPILLTQYYPYLDHDGSGHFQVGRGYDKNGDDTNLVGFFEPWNQQRFHPDEPYISRVQWRSAYKSYRANLAHFQHNIGV